MLLGPSRPDVQIRPDTSGLEKWCQWSSRGSKPDHDLGYNVSHRWGRQLLGFLPKLKYSSHTFLCFNIWCCLMPCDNLVLHNLPGSRLDKWIIHMDRKFSLPPYFWPQEEFNRVYGHSAWHFRQGFCLCCTGVVIFFFPPWCENLKSLKRPTRHFSWTVSQDLLGLWKNKKTIKSKVQI